MIGISAILIAVFTGVSLLYYFMNTFDSAKYKAKYISSDVDLSKVTILMPVYNESVSIFIESINSVAKQGCKFVVVGDSNDDPYRSIVESLGGTFIFQKKHLGQKGTIATGMTYVNTEYVMFVDSDTILPENAAKSLMSRFTYGVGGVGANITVRRTYSKIGYMSEFIERSKEVVYKAMSFHGSVMNLDGPCAMYDTKVIKPFILSDEFVHSKVLGRPSQLGEDWLMTNYIIRKGLLAVKDFDTKVETYPQASLKKFWKQSVRWGRSGWVRLGREIKDGTMTKAGRFYSFELSYVYILPVFTLVMALIRVGIFLNFHPYFFDPLRPHDFLDFTALDRFASHMAGRIGIGVIGYAGSAVFLTKVASQITPGQKLRTIAYGSIALLIMFCSTIYGLFTFWKRTDWLTR